MIAPNLQNWKLRLRKLKWFPKISKFSKLYNKGSNQLYLTIRPEFLKVCVFSRPVVFDSLESYGLQPVRLLCPWDFSSKNTGVDYHFLFRGSSPPRGQKASSMFPALQADSLPRSLWGALKELLSIEKVHTNKQKTTCHKIREPCPFYQQLSF